jgi:hypothetical protein
MFGAQKLYLLKLFGLCGNEALVLFFLNILFCTLQDQPHFSDAIEQQSNAAPALIAMISTALAPQYSLYWINYNLI